MKLNTINIGDADQIRALNIQNTFCCFAAKYEEA